MNKLINTGLSEQDLKKLHSVFADFTEIDSVTLYGSRAMNTFKPGSDIDLTIQLKNGVQPDLSLYTLVANALDDLNLIYLIDLSFMSEIQNQDLIDHIKRVGIKVYQAK